MSPDHARFLQSGQKAKQSGPKTHRIASLRSLGPKQGGNEATATATLIVDRASSDVGASFKSMPDSIRRGQTLEIRNKQLTLDGKRLTEPYTIHTDPNVKPAGYENRDNFGPITVDPGKLFMMGDNRDNSNDSRYWGTLDMDLVKGRAMFLYWSWDGDKSWPRWNRLLQVIH